MVLELQEKETNILIIESVVVVNLRVIYLQYHEFSGMNRWSGEN